MESAGFLGGKYFENRCRNYFNYYVIGSCYLCFMGLFKLFGKSGQFRYGVSMVDRKTIRKEIENFKQKTVEQYFVHTCGYDFVIDQINADVTFTGTKKECEFFIENNKLKKWFEEIHKDVQASNHDYLILLEQKAQLENQIEKMKCCSNCVHFDFIEPNYCQKGVYRANKNVCGEWCFGN